MTLKEFYVAVGGDYDEALTRLMNEAIVRKFLLKFLNDDSYSILEASFNSGDMATAFRGAHTLKGVTSSLGLGSLLKSASELTEELRDQESIDIARAKSLFDKVTADYEQAIGYINQI